MGDTWTEAAGGATATVLVGRRPAGLVGLGADLVPAVRLAVTARSSASEVVRERLRAQLRAMLDTESEVRVDAADSVHRMRVASRRIRSALRTFGPVVGGDLDRLDGELRWLAAGLGAARDAEVLRERLLDRVAELPADLVIGPVRARIEDRLDGDTARARRRLLDDLDGPRYRALVADVLGLVEFGPTDATARRRWDRVLPHLVRGELRRMRRRVRATRGLPPGERRDEAFHRVRKTAKRVRYGAETLRPLAGGDAGRFVRRLQAVQEVLGERQDAVVAAELLRDEGEAAGPAAGENGFTFGILVAHEHDAAGAADGAFAAAWDRLDRPKLRAWLD